MRHDPPLPPLAVEDAQVTCVARSERLSVRCELAEALHYRCDDSDVSPEESDVMSDGAAFSRDDEWKSEDVSQRPFDLGSPRSTLAERVYPVSVGRVILGCQSRISRLPSSVPTADRCKHGSSVFIRMRKSS